MGQTPQAAAPGNPAATGNLAARQIDFNRDVRPLLSDRCFQCHGPDAEHRKADLRLDQLAELEESGVIVAGKADESELVRRIISTDAEELMPPADSGKKLSSQEIAILRQWVAQGAKLSEHWAYVPPTRHPLPHVQTREWPRNWVDTFVLSKLEENGLAPAPIADPVTLIRRLRFDLTGLPPTLDEVTRFLRDNPADRVEKLIDRLLASPEFGERLAVYWLDLVRFADTVGYHGDQDHSISPYRDWVIQAFNDNLPFDQFTRAQIAGDLLPDSTIDDKIASGYNRLLQTSHEGGVQPKEYLAIYAADRVRNVSAVWLGATLGCAQCHDHKYDPFTARDFYSMSAFFADVDEIQHFSRAGNSLPTERFPELKVLSRNERRQLAAVESQISDLQSRLKSAQSDIKSTKSVTAGDDPQPAPVANEAIAHRLNQLNKRRDILLAARRRTMVTVAVKPRTIRLLPRGNWLDESGPVVPPQVPAFMGAIQSDSRPNRLDLANWLTSPEAAGPLTARVMANRVWYLLLGRGLASVLDDFGGQGQPPSHPQLLDNLALELLDNNWDLKHLFRVVAASSAYRQSSQASAELVRSDPYNTLLARQARFHLAAEMVRDNALSLSGLLIREIGGPSVRPYQPAGYYRHLNFPKRTYQMDRGRRQWRRGLYVHWQRQFLHPMLKAFDAPSREECAARRPQSTTPLQALALLNDPTFVEAARLFARRIVAEGGHNQQTRLAYAFQLAVSRPPDSRELNVLGRLLRVNRDYYRQHPKQADKLLQVGLARTPLHTKAAGGSHADSAVELAAWTTVSRALLNLNETMTRN